MHGHELRCVDDFLMLTYAPATRADIVQFYGGVRETLKAICVKRDGVPVGFVGLAIEPQRARFFSEYRDLSCAELCRGWRAVKAAMRYVHESRRLVVSVAENEQGHKNLKRLGFTHIDGEVYAWLS
jgi:hypothetical protein